jgi:hypothetical protein
VRAFENRVLRGIFWPKRDEVSRESRKLHTEEINDPYCSPNIIQAKKSRRIRWAGHVACMWRDAYRVLVGNPQRKRLLGIPRRRWEDNIKMDL